MKRGKQSAEHLAKRIASARATAEARGLTWVGGKPPGNTVRTLWQKIVKGSPDECWLWMAGKNKGYGRMDLHGLKGVYAHRIAYFDSHPGEITLDCKDGKHVLHKCDTPACCNPAHLYLGDHAQNMRDKKERGRNPDFRGSKGPNAKLSDDDVRDIRLFKRIGATKTAIALLFDVSIFLHKDFAVAAHLLRS